MPRDKRSSPPLYERGTAAQRFWVDWDRKRDGQLRSPYLTVFWYDPAAGREKSSSSRSTDLAVAANHCDAIYLRETKGLEICRACGRPLEAGNRGVLVTEAIANYCQMVAPTRSSGPALRARLSHVVGYVGSLPSSAVYCHQIDEDWIEGFRAWALRQPIVSPMGNRRQRSTGTVEASVRQLAAAINFHPQSGGAKFRARHAKDVSQTPLHRSNVAELARMFSYCIDPKGRQGSLTGPERARKLRERSALLRYLQLGVATLARPDALLDFSLDPKRRQWLRMRQVIALNPKGRQQTKKYRAVVKAPRQMVPILNEAAGRFVGPSSIRKAWEKMAQEIGLPAEGEAGTKLIRRSMAVLLRDRGVSKEERDLQMGHAQEGAIGDSYAPFDPDYLRNATAAIEDIIEEIEGLAPGSFCRIDTGHRGDVLELRRA